MSTANLIKDLKTKKVIFGTERTIKALKNGKVESVYLSSNCPENVKEDINYYSKIAKAKVYELKESNEELATTCKKPFMISVISVIK